MNTKQFVIIWLGSIALASVLTWFGTYKYYTQPLPPGPPVNAQEVISPIIPMEPNLTFQQALGELKHYRQDPFKIEWTVLEQSRSNIDVMIEGKIYARTFLQEANIPLIQAESQNWKIAFGAVLGVAACGGVAYGLHKLDVF